MRLSSTRRAPEAHLIKRLVYMLLTQTKENPSSSPAHREAAFISLNVARTKGISPSTRNMTISVADKVSPV